MRPPKGLNKKWSLGEVVALVKEVDRALVVCCGEGGGGRRKKLPNIFNIIMMGI